MLTTAALKNYSTDKARSRSSCPSETSDTNFLYDVSIAIARYASKSAGDMFAISTPASAKTLTDAASCFLASSK